MNYKVLYRKYRPSDFDNLVGQDYTKRMLTNIIKSGKIGHAYIFTGPRGTGKTSSAKLFAKAINCLEPVNGNPCGKCVNCQQFNDSPDIIEIAAASNNGVDEMRELIDNVKLSPSALKYKVYIIDEVHMLSQSAFNALLLTLEEPPGHVVFILATTDIQNVPITILSRCQRFDFRPIDLKDIISRLRFVANEEKIDISDDALQEIAYISAGGMRDALSILDQLAADNEKIDVDTVISNFGTISTERVRKFVNNIVNNEIIEVLNFLADIKEKGVYYSIFLEKLISELRDYGVGIKLGKKDGDFELIYDLILDLNGCLGNINLNVNPYTLIEITILKYLKNENLSLTNKVENNNIDNESEINYSSADYSSAEIENDVKDNEHKFAVENVKLQDGNDNKQVKRVVINDNFLKIRINNCFCDAKKERKEFLSSKWQELLDYLAVNDMYMMSLLADCVVEAASDTYAIISSKVDSTNSLINSSINEIETLFKNLYNIDYRFVAVTSEEWLKAKKEYITNIKNNISYTFIDEEYADSLLESSDELEKLANEIFGSDNIEFE